MINMHVSTHCGGGGGHGRDQVEWKGSTELQVLLRDKLTTKLANKLDGSQRGHEPGSTE